VLTVKQLGKLLLAGLLAANAPRIWAQIDTGRTTGLDRQRDLNLPYTDAVGEFNSSRDAVRVLPLLKRVADDQRQFWVTPLELRRPAAFKTFLPLAGLTTVMIASDRSMAHQVPESQVQRSQRLSNYATFTLAGGVAGMYAFGKLTSNDHLRETGLLSGEAVFNSTLITVALQRSTGRQTPSEGGGKGAFFKAGDSFPSEHATLAWSLASTIAHEYPGPLTKLVAYGLATTVAATRVTGKQHFPTDVVVGSVLGWYMGRTVYRRHHDPELGGASWGELQDVDDPADNTEKEPRSPGRMGSPYLPLDSWVYPAIERLAAFGYAPKAFIGLKPWTRMECAQLIEQANETTEYDDGVARDVVDLESRLQREFSYELALLNGGRERNRTAQLESVYLRGVSVSGPVLADSYHFGQTLAYDFGRPFRRGTNVQAGGSIRAALGPAAVFVRAEFQHAPAGPPLSDAVRSFIVTADQVPAPAANALAPINRPRLLDAYIALNLREGWQLSFGKQSLSWAPGPGGSFLWSDNIEPVPMFRLTQSEAHLPGFLRVLGPARLDSFFGRLEGHTYIPNPYVYGNKINFKPLPNLELGFGRSCQIGGKGGDPLTTKNFLLSVFGQVNHKLDSVPGDSNSSFDWSFYVPKIRNYLVFYGDWYADDDFVPFQNPPKNPYRPGIYLTRFPHLPKLDFHLEVASTDSPQFSNHGHLNYWNHEYRDGYTNNGNLIGNTVGRMGRVFQCWFNYWISPGNTLQLAYKHNTVSPDFVPHGGAWQDYTLRNDMSLRSGFYVRSQLQYQHISSYPLLFSGAHNNLTAVVELGLIPQRPK